MARKIVILESAKEDYKAIQRYVKQNFGDAVWNSVNAKYKKAFQRIQNNPQIGRYLDELEGFGAAHIRYLLLEQTRIVYEFDDVLVIVHMFIDTKRDFRTHLLKRLLSSL